MFGRFTVFQLRLQYWGDGQFFPVTPSPIFGSCLSLVFGMELPENKPFLPWTSPSLFVILSPEFFLGSKSGLLSSLVSFLKTIKESFTYPNAKTRKTQSKGVVQRRIIIHQFRTILEILWSASANLGSCIDSSRVTLNDAETTKNGSAKICQIFKCFSLQSTLKQPFRKMLNNPIRQPRK